MDISSVASSTTNPQATDTTVADTTDVTTDTSSETSATDTTTDSSSTTGGTQGTTADFRSFMLKALGGTAKSQLSEEELFAEIIGKRLQETNPEAADFYNSEKSKLLVSMARPSDGYVSYENVAISALKATVDAGKIDEATAKQVNGDAFAAAQLDSDTTALWDDRGSGSDTTIAVASFDDAMNKVDELLAKISSGEITPTARELSTVSTSGGASASGGADSGTVNAAGASSLSGQQQLDGSGGFLWKPESDRDGNLVVLLPTELNGLIEKVELYSEMPPSPEGLLGSGKFTSVGNGDRSHFRFSKSGGEYGENVNVVVTKSDGEQVYWTVPNGNERTD